VGFGDEVAAEIASMTGAADHFSSEVPVRTVDRRPVSQ
jgi:hypothetical protein